VTATLDELGRARGTDKSSYHHDYLCVYDELLAPLRDKPITFLELGVCYGLSIHMWADYFTHPDTVIHGIDNGSYGSFQGELPPNVMLYEGDQAQKPPDWLSPQLDIVIDDASHDPAKTEASFRLWFQAVRPGGIYVVEDISERDIGFLNGLVWGIANRNGEFGIEWIRFSHDLCIMRKSSGVVVANGDTPGVIVVASPPKKHLWTGS
jgi:hypothetical protein